MNGPARHADGNVSAGGDGDDHRDDPRAQFRASVARIAAAGRLFAELPGHRRSTDTASHTVFIPLLNTGPLLTSPHTMRPKQLSDFMRNNFKRVKCQLCAKVHPDSRICKFCNRSEEEHDGCLMPNAPELLEPEFVYLPTDAYGTLSFPNKRLAAEYVRLAFDVKTPETPGNIIRLFREFWNLPPPDLVVSVIGGFQSFKMSNEKQRQIFNEGLINAIDATRGWLITYGNNQGIAKVVGDAVRDGQAMRLRRGIDDKIVCIGIVAWGNIMHNEMLTFNNPPETAMEKYIIAKPYYHHEKAGVRVVGGNVRTTRVTVENNIAVKPIVLNPDHTHFLMADNGFNGERSLSGAARLRAALEKHINESYERASVVALVVEGGMTSLDQLYETVMQGTQVLVCEGTGRLADVIARGCLYAKLKEPEFTVKMENAVRDAFFASTTLQPNESRWLAAAIKRIYEICANEDQVTVFKFSSRKDLDVALLRCILKKSGDNDCDKMNLELALTWGRHDVAEDIASKPGFDPEKPDIFNTAIWANKVPFVQLLVNHGFNVANYLTRDVLEGLYQMTAQQTPWFCEMLKVKNRERSVLLTDVSKLLLRFTNCRNRYLTNNIEDPFHELFVYSVLFNRYGRCLIGYICEMALYFWSQSERPLMCALIGAWLAENLSTFFQGKFNETLVQSYYEMKKKMVKVAVGVLDRAYDSNPEWANTLINSTGSPQWPHVTMIEVGALAEAEEFIAHECCQRQIFRSWSQGYECNRKKYIASFLLVWPIFLDYFVRFDHENASAASHTKDPTLLDDPDDFDLDSANTQLPGLLRGDSGESKDYFTVKGEDNSGEQPQLPVISPLMKPVIFYGSACSKFIVYTCWYMIFLALYSSVMLFEFEEHQLSVIEILIYFWQLTLNMEMLNTIISANSDNFWSRVGLWYHNGSFGTWHKLDAVNGLLSWVAFVLRIINLNMGSEFLYPIARLLMVINLIVYFLRLFKTFFVNAYLGPKVIMIWRMAGDLVMFLLFFLVFMLAYSVSSRSFAKPNQEYHFGIFWDLISHGLWEIFGEANPDNKEGHIEGCNNYTGQAWFSSGASLDCYFRTMMLPILLTLYMFVATILLVNMLIAIFTHIFDSIDENSRLLWKYQMYFLIKEYDTKFVLPPPFIIIYHICLTAKKIFRCFFPDCHVHKKPQDSIYEAFMVSFEKVCRSEYLNKEEADKNDVDDRLDRIEKLLRDMQTGGSRAAASSDLPTAMIPRASSPQFFCDNSEHSGIHLSSSEHLRLHRMEDEAETNEMIVP